MAERMPAPCEKWMRLAVELASRGAGRTHPNPSVGAVVVRGGKVAGKGFHLGPGRPHAEVAALREAGDSARGADLYVTLEPCQTFGKTPPCTEAVIEAGIRRVIAGTKDPNPRVNGRGISSLRRNGITVVEDFLSDEAVKADIAYHVFYRKKRPFVSLKWAQSLDGVTSKAGGGYITGIEARRRVHEERFLSDAIVVTSGTVLRDNPQLTIRLARSRKPLLRIVVDRHGLKELPDRLLNTAPGQGEIWIVKPASLKGSVSGLPGVRTFELGCGKGLDLFLPEMLRLLREKNVMSLYVESVGELATQLLNSRLVDRLSIDVAPVVLGKGSAPDAVCLPLKKPLPLVGADELILGNDRIYQVDLEGKCLRG